MIKNFELTPQEIVKQLDRHIVGQEDAKRAIAIAFRNRWRRKNVSDKNMRDEITPKNILMIGSTGVGKTEISRRMARLTSSPFIKVEATKFTEVGYVGRDVDSIIRDLIDIAILIIKDNMRKDVETKAKEMAEERVLDALVGNTASEDTRKKFLKKLRKGELNDKEIEIDILDNSPPMGGTFDIPGVPGGQMGVLNVSDMLNKVIGGGRTKTKRMTVAESYGILINEESDKIIDEEKIIKEALDLVENEGIVFIDELDKVCVRQEGRSGEVSREGVQRDLLPLIEGTAVSTKYGTVKTDHILFIGSGAFHMSKPSDLLPELQGRLPIRVELKALNEKEFVRILEEPESSLPKQYTALLETEEIDLSFTKDGIKRIAAIAAEVNSNVENIGARRLHTIMEKLLEKISFEATEMEDRKIKIDADYVEKQLGDLTTNIDLSKFIL